MRTSPEASPLARAPGGKVPDFFIVGNPKSGTTALYEMLKPHPQIYMPDLKETRFFARELHPNAEPPELSESSETSKKRRPETVEEYLGLFAGAVPGQRAGEASPSYLRSHDAAGRIARMQPDARIIAILREPASFLRSLHMELLRDHVETEKDLGKAIALEDVRRREREVRRSPGLVYSDYVRYVEQLERFHAVFPRERVLVLIYDDFRADNEGTVRRVLRFLEVDDTAPIEVTEANPTVRVRSPRLNRIVRSLYTGRGPVGGAVKSAIKAVTPRRVRRDGLEAFQRRVLVGEPRPPDEELMLQLRRRYKGEVVALSEYLDRDLVTLWGYDSIA
jgi:hypothetical protein